MMPGSINLPVRKREEKGRRKEGKSQCRRGTTKSKITPAVVSLPNKTPSPASTPSSTPAPPVVIPPVATVPLPLNNMLKDPTAMSPNVIPREAKAIRRRVKEKVDKDPPKATIRKKKSSATEAKSISIEGKTSSENDGPNSHKGNKKKKSQTSTDSVDNKSEGSKEPSSNDEKTPKRFNKELAQSFFKQMFESQRAKKRAEDHRLETMPESSQINASARSMRKKKGNKGPAAPKDPKDDNFFKPNGEPVWVVPERKDGECEKNEDGTPIRNPELVAALADDDIEMDEKDWPALIKLYLDLKLESGLSISDDYEFDIYGFPEKFVVLNEIFKPDTITYNTLKTLFELSEAAIKRFQNKDQGIDDEPVHRPTPHPKTIENSSTLPNMPPKLTVSTELFQLKTCVHIPNVSFDMKKLVNVKYDRHRARASIQKFRKKLNYSMEQTTQGDTK